MAKSLQELQEDASEVLEAFAAVESAASTLDARLSAASARVGEDREAIQAALDGLAEDVQALDGEVAGFAQAATTTLSRLEEAMREVAGSIQDATALTSEAFADASSTFETVTTAFGASTIAIENARATHVAAAEQRRASLATWSDETQALSDSAAARIQEVTTRAEGLRGDAVAFQERLEITLGAQRQELEAWHDDFLSAAAQSVSDLAAKIVEMGIVQIREPIATHIGGMQHELQATAVQVLSGVLAGVEDALRKIEDEIGEVAGGTRAKREAMAPARESLDALKEPINAVLDVVRSTASIVGFSP